MSEATKEDINRVHDRLDKIVEVQGETSVAVGRIEERLNSMPRPLPRPCPEHTELRKDFDEHIDTRPCPEHEDLRKDFDEHIEAHTETRRLWQRPLVAALIHLGELAIMALLTFVAVKVSGG